MHLKRLTLIWAYISCKSNPWCFVCYVLLFEIQKSWKRHVGSCICFIYFDMEYLRKKTFFYDVSVKTKCLFFQLYSSRWMCHCIRRYWGKMLFNTNEFHIKHCIWLITEFFALQGCVNILLMKSVREKLR